MAYVSDYRAGTDSAPVLSDPGPVEALRRAGLVRQESSTSVAGMRDLMVKSVKKLPPVQEQGPAPVKVVPQYVVDLLACDPQGDRPPSLELEVASYRTLYWGMENGLLDKPVGLHMYELCRTGGTDRVLVDLKRRLAEPLQDS